MRTGVFREGTTPRFRPMATVDNVLEAVKHGMQREVGKAMKSQTKDGSGEGRGAMLEDRLGDAAAIDD